jgi:hypothetical protein
MAEEDVHNMLCNTKLGIGVSSTVHRTSMTQFTMFIMNERGLNFIFTLTCSV